MAGDPAGRAALAWASCAWPWPARVFQVAYIPASGDRGVVVDSEAALVVISPGGAGRGGGSRRIDVVEIQAKITLCYDPGLLLTRTTVCSPSPVSPVHQPSGQT